MTLDELQFIGLQKFVELLTIKLVSKGVLSNEEYEEIKEEVTKIFLEGVEK